VADLAEDQEMQEYRAYIID